MTDRSRPPFEPTPPRRPRQSPTAHAIAATSLVIREFVFARNAERGVTATADQRIDLAADADALAAHLAECGMLHI